MKNLNVLLMTATIVASGWVGSVSAVTFDTQVRALQAPTFNSAATDEGGLCICEKVNDEWICRPVGCIGQLSPERRATDLLQQPIAPRVLPGDQYQRPDIHAAPLRKAERLSPRR